MHLHNQADKYKYEVEWCAEEGAYVGRCVEFPSLKHIGPSPGAALEGIRALVAFGLDRAAQLKIDVSKPLAAKEDWKAENE